jgi:predicted metalloprotease with PDZ domain
MPAEMMPAMPAETMRAEGGQGPKVVYQVRVEDPKRHLVEVEVRVDAGGEAVRLAMPVWTPGSYLVREFARQIERFEAQTEDGRALACVKRDKHTWEVEATQGVVVARYWLNAQELGVRQPYLDDAFGFFLGTNLCCWVVGRQDWRVEVGFSLPTGWRVISPKIEGFVGDGFGCVDYDALADTTMLLGALSVVEFEVLGRPHGFVVAGETRIDLPRVVRETARVIEACAGVFGGEVPYERYLFILLAAESIRGGLEHSDSVALIFARTAFREEETHSDLMTLISHEFFHVWNVKRIHTDALGPPFDYSREHLTKDLWVAEGWTVYYEAVTALRARVIDGARFCKDICGLIKVLEAQPGRWVQSLEASSFDAWIKLYRPDGNSPNVAISYYTKGGLVACLLDLEIRRRTGDARSLDDVMRYLWAQFGSKGCGYPEGTMQQQVEAVVGGDWQGWFDVHMRQPGELVWDEALGRVGLCVKREAAADAPPWLGVRTEGAKGLRLLTVYRGGPAEDAGLMAEDELVALDGWRLTPEKLDGLLRTYQVGDEVEVTFWRQGRLRVGRLLLAAPPVVAQSLAAVEGMTQAQRQALAAWLGPQAAAALEGDAGGG